MSIANTNTNRVYILTCGTIFIDHIFLCRQQSPSKYNIRHKQVMHFVLRSEFCGVFYSVAVPIRYFIQSWQQLSRYYAACKPKNVCHLYRCFLEISLHLYHVGESRTSCQPSLLICCFVSNNTASCPEIQHFRTAAPPFLICQ